MYEGLVDTDILPINWLGEEIADQELLYRDCFW